MKRFLLPAILLSASLSVLSFADNPVVQTSFTADPAPMVYKDTLYLYTSHDEDDARGFHMLNWKCYTTTDMTNWTDHGTIASLATFKWAGQNNDAWAPQVVPRDGKFYLYVPIRMQGANVIAVAVADNPFGPFTDVLGKPLVPKGNGYIDPTVFVDDDGQAYLYFGNPNLWYVRLNKDMMSYSGSIVKVASKPRNYQEGPWFYKRDGHYYMAYASTCCPEGIGYAMSDSATGPWDYKGMIMDPDKRSSGNHPGIVDYKGKSYVFGFNYALNLELTSTHRERRSVCAEVMTYNPDGTIQKHDWWSTQGAPQVGTFDPFVPVDAATICYENGVRTKARSGDKQGVYVTVNDSKAWIKVKGVDFGAGAGSFAANIASGGPGGTLELHLDSQTGTQIGTLPFGNTGDWENWRTLSTRVTGASGLHDLYFVFKGLPDGHVCNFDSWKFEKQ